MPRPPGRVDGAPPAPPAPPSIGQRLGRIFLGSSTTFRNQNRNWVYLVFLAVVVGLLVLAKCKGSAA